MGEGGEHAASLALQAKPCAADPGAASPKQAGDGGAQRRTVFRGRLAVYHDHSRQPECSATMPPLMRWNDTRPKPAVRIMPANASGRGKRRIDSTR